jgi:hypothetical protein
MGSSDVKSRTKQPPSSVGRVSTAKAKAKTQPSGTSTFPREETKGDRDNASVLLAASNGFNSTATTKKRKQPEKKPKKKTVAPKKKAPKKKTVKQANVFIFDEAEEASSGYEEEEGEDGFEQSFIDDEPVEDEDESEKEEKPRKVAKKPTAVAASKSRKQLPSKKLKIDSKMLRKAKKMCERGEYSFEELEKQQADEDGEEPPSEDEDDEEEEEEEEEEDAMEEEEEEQPTNHAKAVPRSRSRPGAPKQGQRITEQFYRRLFKLDAPNRRAMSNPPRKLHAFDSELHRNLARFGAQARKSFEQAFKNFGCDFKSIQEVVTEKQQSARPRARTAVAPTSQLAKKKGQPAKATKKTVNVKPKKKPAKIEEEDEESSESESESSSSSASDSESENPLDEEDEEEVGEIDGDEEGAKVDEPADEPAAVATTTPKKIAVPEDKAQDGTTQ